MTVYGSIYVYEISVFQSRLHYFKSIQNIFITEHDSRLYSSINV